MKIELLPGGKAPTRATDGSGAFDCYVREVELQKNYYGFGLDPDRYDVIGATLKLGFKLDCNAPYGEYNEGIENEGWLNMNFAALLMPRSGWGTKYGFRLLNTIGLIDSDYRGEVIAKVAFDECPPELLEFANSECNRCSQGNDFDYCFGECVLKKVKQPRVCQIAIVPVYVGELTIVDKLDDKERGEGGFGSTGVA